MRNKLIIVFLLTVFFSHSAFAGNWQLLRGNYKLEKKLIDKHELKRSLEQDLPWAYRIQPKKKYVTPNEVLNHCPTEGELAQINLDFKISFDKDVAPYECTDGGKESNVQLTIYNAFRMMQAIPFDKEFPWAAGYDNLYEWMKSLKIKEITVTKDLDHPGEAIWEYMWINSSKLHLPSYRKIFSSVPNDGGGGLVSFMVLLTHEARHTMGYFHTCDDNDKNLEEKGAWAVQYELLEMMAKNTDLFFAKQSGKFIDMAVDVYNTRFCDYHECQKSVECMNMYNDSYTCTYGQCVKNNYSAINYPCVTNLDCLGDLACNSEYQICVQWCVKSIECGADRFCNQQVGFCADNDDPVWGK